GISLSGNAIPASPFPDGRESLEFSGKVREARHGARIAFSCLEEATMDDSDDGASERPERRRFTDFDCPDCSANNPWDEAFGTGDQVHCHYCGAQFEARVAESGRLRLKPI